jgi:hypothetical protein
MEVRYISDGLSENIEAHEREIHMNIAAAASYVSFINVAPLIQNYRHVRYSIVLTLLYANTQHYLTSLIQYNLTNLHVIHNTAVPGDM